LRKLTLTSLVTVFLFVLIAGSNSAYSQLKFGYVDSEVILKQLPESQKVLSDLEAIQKLYVDTVSAKEKELKSKAEIFKGRYEDAQKQVESGQIKSDTELKKLNEDISELQKEIQTLDEGLSLYKQKIQSDLVQRQNEMFKPIKEKIVKAIEEVSRTMKINFVLDKSDGALLYGDKEFDITFKILDKLK
jgi:Outer membrane protein